MSPKQGSRPSPAGRTEPDEASSGSGWTTAVDGTSRIYVDLVKVACAPSTDRWYERHLLRGGEAQSGLEYPVHGWLRRQDRAVRTLEGSDRTLCGRRLDDLRWRDLDHLSWVEVQPVMQCRICAVVLGPR